jgi:beta-glucosidase-like glycosyl hydrolase
VGIDRRDVAVTSLLRVMTREQKLAQLAGLWVTCDQESGKLAAYRDPVFGAAAEPGPLEGQLPDGIGELTRPLGSAPVDAAQGAAMIEDLQRHLREASGPGIPAIVHEECLTGLMALGATAFPSPLNWGSTWDPGLIRQVGEAIGAQMRSVGAHQGLAPVLDVVRDPRWGRVEECIGEDPYLVGVIGLSYIQGLQGGDFAVTATAKHFAGYSFSEGGRNWAPAHVGPREMADVFLVPFEMAVREGHVGSVMNAYQENDGVPAAASRELLTEVLRDSWGFEGVVVSDYYSVDWLHLLHATASSKAEAAAAALRAGIDVELPNPDCYAAPLGEAAEAGLVEEADIDRSVERVLRLKARLGLLDGPARRSGEHRSGGPVDLDPPEHRALSRRVAQASIVLLQNDGMLPLDPGSRSIAVIGPCAASRSAPLGNYCFDNHVASHLEHPPEGVEVVTVAQGIGEAVAASSGVRVARGCEVLGGDRAGFGEAVSLASSCDAAVVVVGDQAGHFGAGTSGEGTDTDDLALPGLQDELVEAVASTGTPTAAVLLCGRPYALERVAASARAVVLAWFPGEEAGRAVADVLFGAVNPAGRTPVTFSRGAGQQPLYYNDKRLGRLGYPRSSTRPVFCFGHGLSYTSFSYGELAVAPDQVPVDGEVEVSCRVANTGPLSGDEVVQLYVSDLVAEVTRPAIELKAFRRVGLEPGEAVQVRFRISSELFSFTGVDLERVVEPGSMEVMVGSSCQDIRLRGRFELVGTRRRLGPGRRLLPESEVVRAPSPGRSGGGGHRPGAGRAPG